MKDEEDKDGEDKADADDDQAKPALIERQGDMLIKRKKIQFFKFWPKTLLRVAWKKYLSAGETGTNMNAAYLAI